MSSARKPHCWSSPSLVPRTFQQLGEGRSYVGRGISAVKRIERAPPHDSHQVIRKPGVLAALPDPSAARGAQDPARRDAARPGPQIRRDGKSEWLTCDLVDSTRSNYLTWSGLETPWCQPHLSRHHPTGCVGGGHWFPVNIFSWCGAAAQSARPVDTMMFTTTTRLIERTILDITGKTAVCWLIAYWWRCTFNLMTISVSYWVYVSLSLSCWCLKLIRP